MSLPTRPGKSYSKLPVKAGSNREVSIKTEKRLARELGARTQPNSGAMPQKSKKADLVSTDFLYEVKETTAKTLSLSVDVANRIFYQAVAIGKMPALVFKLSASVAPAPAEWVAVPKDIFTAMLNQFDTSNLP